MQSVVIKEEIRIPNTEIILEENDRIFFREDLSLTPEQVSSIKEFLYTKLKGQIKTSEKRGVYSYYIERTEILLPVGNNGVIVPLIEGRDTPVNRSNTNYLMQKFVFPILKEVCSCNLSFIDSVGLYALFMKSIPTV